MKRVIKFAKIAVRERA